MNTYLNQLQRQIDIQKRRVYDSAKLAGTMSYVQEVDKLLELDKKLQSWKDLGVKIIELVNLD